MLDSINFLVFPTETKAFKHLLMAKHVQMIKFPKRLNLTIQPIAHTPVFSDTVAHQMEKNEKVKKDETVSQASSSGNGIEYISQSQLPQRFKRKELTEHEINCINVMIIIR